MSYIFGDKALIAKLTSLRKTQAKAAIRKGTRAGSKIVQAKAQELAPQKTGQLRQSIKVRALPRSRVWTGTTIKLAIFYGAFLEYGLKNRKLAARHFLKHAVDAVGKEAMETALAIIKSEVDAI